MHCEFCDLTLSDLSSARRHMLSIAHNRKKRTYDMSSTKIIQTKRRSLLHPKDFLELLKTINVHTVKDVIALDDPSENFFKVDDKIQSLICRELMSVLNESINNFNLNSLPAEIRQPLLEAWARRTR